MSDNEEFLARWSRRKRQAKPDGQAEPRSAEPLEMHGEAASGDKAAAPAEGEVDLLSLPPIDTIDAATDITAFLRKNIPQELTRAALRRAWTADPAIRDFVGLAENAWDFNDPHAMAGFGPLDCPQAALSEMAERIVGGIEQAAASLSETVVAIEDVPQQAAPPSSLGQTIADSSAIDQETTTLQKVPVAPQPVTAEKVNDEDSPVRRRTHGGALPR
ncbi:MAG: DUF3306 domain-containing protein [Bradyrhizobium sp.]|nr:DUF3306 domain-containing protein [Bradyrhizobium sp.]